MNVNAVVWGDSFMKRRGTIMKKLFKAIRQDKIEEVKSMIEKNPALVNCVATPPPKKDNGQSPLQVAVKIGAFEIIDYLMEHNADVNFMEAEDGVLGLRCPVLHDAIRTVLDSLCYGKIDVSDKGMEVVEKLLKGGADPNKRASNGFDALNTAISHAEHILEYKTDSEICEKAEQQIVKLFDLLIEHGADFQDWVNRGHFPEPYPMESNKERYIDEFFAVDGMKDNTARTRAVMQCYCKDRGYIDFGD